MRVSPTGRISVVLAVMGTALLTYSIHWLRPHSQVVLDMPISLSPGRISTGNFNVELDTLYYMEIETNWTAGHFPVGCDPRSVLGTQWALSSGERVVDRGSSPWEDSGLAVGNLFSADTQYALDINVSPGASCLNAGNPRLKIQTHVRPDDLYTCLIWFSLWCVGIGLVLGIRLGLPGVFSEKPTPRIFPEMVVRNVVSLRRPRPMPPMKDLPNFGLICGFVVFPLMVIFMILQPLPSRGLLVTVGGRTAAVWHKSPWPETLAVYVDGQGKFYVNGQQVLREALRAKLSDELRKRMLWTVYFEADKDSAYGDAIYSIDTIQGLGAEVFWITPRVREELNAPSALANR
jgi:biopolymer transport protein ExbD